MSVKADPGGFPQRKCSESRWVTAAQMRDVQRIAQEEFGLDILQLTENAGRSAALLALAMLGGKGRGQRIVILCGNGNKGAAGLAAAHPDRQDGQGPAARGVLRDLVTTLGLSRRAGPPRRRTSGAPRAA